MDTPKQPWWRKKRWWAAAVASVVVGTPIAAYLYDQHDPRGEAARVAALLRTARRIEAEGRPVDRRVIEDLAALLEGAPRVERKYGDYSLEGLYIDPYRSSSDREPADRVSVAYNGMIRFYRPGDDRGMYLVFADGRGIYSRLGGEGTGDYWVEDLRADGIEP